MNRRLTLRNFCLVLILVGCASACNKEDCPDCLQKAGSMARESRDLDVFREIRLSDRINLVITQDTVNRVLIEAGKNLIPEVVTQVEAGVLTIRDDNTCNWVRSYENSITVYLQCKELRNIYYDGAGSITGTNEMVADTLEVNLWDGSGKIRLQTDCDELRVHLHTGCGDVEIYGKARNAYYYSRGNGQIHNENLDVPGIYIDASCTGDLFVRATEHIFARLGYDGNVYYWGKPANVESEISGNGRLIPME
jgi:hypothetical protein